MINAQIITGRLGGHWYGRFGSAPCPVCQPEAHKGQNALTLADNGKGLLLNCKRLCCSFRDILTAAGIAPGTITPLDLMLKVDKQFLDTPFYGVRQMT